MSRKGQRALTLQSMSFEIIQARGIMMLCPVVFGDEIAGTQVNISEVRNRVWGWTYTNLPLLSPGGFAIAATRGHYSIFCLPSQIVKPTTQRA